MLAAYLVVEPNAAVPADGLGPVWCAVVSELFGTYLSGIIPLVTFYISYALFRIELMKTRWGWELRGFRKQVLWDSSTQGRNVEPLVTVLVS